MVTSNFIEEIRLNVEEMFLCFIPNNVFPVLLNWEDIKQ